MSCIFTTGDLVIVKLFRRFLPIKTTTQWPALDTQTALVVRAEVAEQMRWEEEEFEMSVASPGWKLIDHHAIIAGILNPDEPDFATDPTTFPWTFPNFAYVERSSKDSELILTLDQDSEFPPIFPITAEALLVGIKI